VVLGESRERAQELTADPAPPIGALDSDRDLGSAVVDMPVAMRQPAIRCTDRARVDLGDDREITFTTPSVPVGGERGIVERSMLARRVPVRSLEELPGNSAAPSGWVPTAPTSFSG
jgi:hypothetical protein